MKKLNIKASDEEILNFINIMDKDGDNNVDFYEFCQYLLMLPPVNIKATFDIFRREY